MKITYINTAVKAGFPSPALDYMEERIDLNKTYIRHPLATFLVECTGDSMTGAFIPPRARLIVDRSLEPRNGDIVLAVIHGEFTVKFLKKSDFKCWLLPANEKYPDIEITPEMNLEVWGVVTAVISETNDLKLCTRL